MSSTPDATNRIAYRISSLAESFRRSVSDSVVMVRGGVSDLSPWQQGITKTKPRHRVVVLS